MQNCHAGHESAIQSALHFIRHLRGAPGLAAQLGVGSGLAALGDLVESGARLGWVFDEDALRAAFRIEWTMRAALVRRP
ncbi:hypothetical protein PIGHUM_04351 [Pigmentiphaga humi]|uniref:Uncharacterized protein n=1 Tax=Pigmentiphaga humi TaxID=2478468 RepID=A0A3P4B869_9BURK|nr:hypothetical protein [Pigmentiphaga humi]VCU72252.1 hypothetical protein PIGHUM_04351 [Pigmentiphaga humi]